MGGLKKSWIHYRLVEGSMDDGICFSSNGETVRSKLQVCHRQKAKDAFSLTHAQPVQLSAHSPDHISSSSRPGPSPLHSTPPSPRSITSSSHPHRQRPEHHQHHRRKRPFLTTADILQSSRIAHFATHEVLDNRVSDFERQFTFCSGFN